jgi:hypothetical protein
MCIFTDFFYFPHPTYQVLFITGATIYWSSTGEEKNSQGLDILIVSAILLLPGSYAVYILYGVWKRWPGFSFHQIPSYD